MSDGYIVRQMTTDPEASSCLKKEPREIVKSGEKKGKKHGSPHCYGLTSYTPSASN
jgi:hypothetical protein